MASAWKEDRKKALIVKGGKKGRMLSFKAMPHKNQLVAQAKHHSLMQSQFQPTIKIKCQEGLYEFRFIVSWKATMKSKFDKKAPLPEECPFETVVEFTELKIGVASLKMPMMHTCEVQVKMNRVKNYGSKNDLSPVAMLDVDIKTGHMVLGKWTTHMKCCDIYSWSNKIKNFK